MWIHKSGLFVQPSIPIEKQKNSLYVDQAVCSVHKNGLVRTHIFLYERNIAIGSFFIFSQVRTVAYPALQNMHIAIDTT